MKKHAYLIMAHNQWELLKTLLNCIDDSRNDIYLHIDKKAKNFPKADIEQICRFSRLIFTKPYDIRWGGTEMMECEINMLETAVGNGEYSYFHLISGVDMPLKSQDYIHDFFDNQPECEFIGFNWNNIDDGAFKYRCKYYYFFTKWIGRGDEKEISKRILYKLNDLSISFQKLLRVDRLHGKSFYKGSQWFSITDKFAQYIVENKKMLLRQYRFCLNADEAFIHNLIKSSPEGMFELAPGNMRYILFQQNQSSPDTLTMQHYSDMINSGRLFARKFDWCIDKEVVLKIADNIKQNNN